MEVPVLKEWIKALRSGNYAQGKTRLHSESGGKHTYCCLGVLCELAVKEKVIPPPDSLAMEVDGKTITVYYYGDDNYVDAKNICILPRKVRNWLTEGLRSGYFPTSVLINMNDRTENPQSFEQIADYLEKEWS